MRVNARGLDTAARAAASLLLLTLAQACAPASNNNDGGATPAPTAQAAPAPAQAAQATPAASPAPGVQSADSPLPAPTGFVNDFAGVLDAGARARLTETLNRLRQRADIELAVATVETTGGRDINDYSLAVARGWGVGPPEGQGGGGVLLLLATADRKWRVQVSRSLEADLPDDVVAGIGQRMVPDLRAARYAEALTACVEGLVKRLAERRGLSAHDLQWILQPPAAASPTPAPKSKTGARGKT